MLRGRSDHCYCILLLLQLLLCQQISLEFYSGLSSEDYC